MTQMDWRSDMRGMRRGRDAVEAVRFFFIFLIDLATCHGPDRVKTVP
jgi:hypothetical protein